MASLTKLGQYYYSRGLSNSPDRKLEFYRSSNDPKTFFVKVYARENIAKSDRKWVEFERVSSDKITVEMISTSEKIKDLQTRRIDPEHAFNAEHSDSFGYQNDKKMSELSVDIQNKIIAKLEPEGSWRIEITNESNTDIGATYEKVDSLNFLNVD
ncbi:MAG: hypothetical protein KR126chlam5_01352 [Candidatus Anoxychlamydiales bacterium]|nr:hypothetical protein [Candidatus Anoxychlamydiales bacterium]